MDQRADPTDIQRVRRDLLREFDGTMSEADAKPNINLPSTTYPWPRYSQGPQVLDLP